jgi:hypothetical protein
VSASQTCAPPQEGESPVGLIYKGVYPIGDKKRVLHTLLMGIFLPYQGKTGMTVLSRTICTIVHPFLKKNYFPLAISFS